MALAAQSTKPPDTSAQYADYAEADKRMDAHFDETDETRDQYRAIFDVNSTSSRNMSGAHLAGSKRDWDDVYNNGEFYTSNDSMDPAKARAMTNPDAAPPTMSHQTLQSMSKLNVSKPIDLSRRLRTSAQSTIDYRMAIEPELSTPDGLLTGILKNTALFGLKHAHAVAKSATIKPGDIARNIDRHITGSASKTMTAY